MHARFFAPEELVPGALVELSEEESHHATRVLRLGIGAAVRVFDGQGLEFHAAVVEAGKRGVTLQVGAAAQPAAEPHVAVTLVQAALKGDKMDDVVRDAVMLGVAAIQPVVTERTEVSLATLERGARRERWQRVAIASAKQCGRAVVPTVAPPMLLERSTAFRPDVFTVMCVEPGVQKCETSMWSLPPAAPPEVRLVIGPEGGWTAEEIARGSSGASLVTLGDGTALRADAMALIALTALYTRWHEI